MRGKTPEDFALLSLLDPIAAEAGFAIVRLRLTGGDHLRRLQVLAEDAAGRLGVEDCARLSRLVSRALDAADPIRSGYLLEVSSPGIDRPLTRQSDFANFAGLEARVELEKPIEGRKRFKGVIEGLESGEAILRGEDGVHRLPFDQIAEAKLVLNQSLLARGAAERLARLADEKTSTFSERR
ncbi:MAG: ribosome maturation factor RimP [Caulobacteraceae bacterium]